jgi:hypothetical protein
MLVRSSLALVVAFGVTGCGATSTYLPANSPRVSLTTSGFYKNGKKYDDLLTAVADNPRAFEEARAAQSNAVTGGWLYLGSLGLTIAGGTVLGVGLAEDDKTLIVAGVGTLIPAFVLAIVSGVMRSHVAPHALDAINIYNDDVEAKMCVKRPAPAPAGPPATPPAAPR